MHVDPRVVTFVQFGTGLTVASSLAAAVRAVLAERLAWSRPVRTAKLAFWSGCLVVLLFCAFGFGHMTVTYMAATRPRLMRAEVERLHAAGVADFVEMTAFGLLLGAPALLAGFVVGRRLNASDSHRV